MCCWQPGIQDAERHMEAEDGWFLTTVFGILCPERKVPGCSGGDKKEAGTLKEHLLDNFPGLHLAGVFFHGGYDRRSGQSDKPD